MRERFAACGLEFPAKPKIVYCKDERRPKCYANTTFDFLGYTFRPRLVRGNKKSRFFVGFTPAVSRSTQKAMREKTRNGRFYRKTGMNVKEISQEYNPVLRGWMNYYGRYHRSALYPIFAYFNRILLKWAMHKYKKLKSHKTKACQFMKECQRKRQIYLYTGRLVC